MDTGWPTGGLRGGFSPGERFTRGWGQTLSSLVCPEMAEDRS